ncbi:kinase-like domain-containing protein [Tribonema minus]|uniref:Kinase-like domain-containing protein n=1 Tax=Tribonema minus TaxID=303371 RepID=A0A835YJJ7_9STRA|nr:kinase-like domain-containing protein [Tribonema minus]
MAAAHTVLGSPTDTRYCPLSHYDDKLLKAGHWRRRGRGWEADPTCANCSLDTHYALGRRLGKGAFSQVYECTCRDTGRKFAVKMVDTRRLRTADIVSLRREVALTSCIEHPGVCAVFDLFHDASGCTALVQELASAGDLFDRIQKRTCFMEAPAAAVMARLLETVAHVHTAGIVHRDIKPENILCVSDSDDTDLKLTDFGFAKRVADLTTCDEACGTPQYVAPEIILGQPYGTQVDVWSLGVVAYALLGGYAPFHAASVQTLFRSIVRADYCFHAKFWAHVSVEAKHFIRCMLQPDPAQRWTAAALLHHPWIAVHAAAPAALLPPPPPLLACPAAVAAAEAKEEAAAAAAVAAAAERCRGRSRAASQMHWLQKVLFGHLRLRRRDPPSIR